MISKIGGLTSALGQDLYPSLLENGISNHMLYQVRFYSRKSIAIVKEVHENSVKVMPRR
jgi:hypothetical protein